MWLPPGVTPDDEIIVEILTATVAIAKHEDMYAALEQMGRAHPTDPHWYLAWLDVERGAQGRGLGAHLLTRCLVGGRLPSGRLSRDAQPPNGPLLRTPRIRESRQYARR
jgi:hypothetical protein